MINVTQVASCTWMYIKTAVTMNKTILSFGQIFIRLYMDIHLDNAHNARAHMQRCKLQLIHAQLLNTHSTVLLRLHLNTGPYHGCDVETPT